MSHLLLLFIYPFIASLLSLAPWPLSKRGTSLLAFLLSLPPLLGVILLGSGSLESYEVNQVWISSLSVSFHVKIDSLAYIFLLLTTLIIPIVIAAESPSTSFKAFYGLVFLLEGLLIGFFTSFDLILFIVFFEAMLFPAYFLITLFGGAERKRAALRFILYMAAGSTLLIAGALSLYIASSLMGQPTFDLLILAKNGVSEPYSFWIFAIFVLAFAVKTPLFPFHGWLPNTYTQASTGGAILLSALLSKAGIFGFLRIVFPLFPTAVQESIPILLALSVMGVFWGAFAAWMQQDFKKVIAYSSLSHVNFILAGLFAWNSTAGMGALLQAFNHGVTIAALFLSVGWLEERLKSSSMQLISGLSSYLPRLCYITLFFVLASVALPGTSNFIGELLILFGLFSAHKFWAVVLASSVILSVVYMLRLMQSVYFGPPHIPLFAEPLRFQDIGWKEVCVALPLVVTILWLGIYPKEFFEYIIPALPKALISQYGVQE